MSGIVSDAERRRTFAIISHPDAGKTTLTEKLLLFSEAIEEGGAVRARAGRQRDVTSDRMELERQRGISITSTVLQFAHHDLVEFPPLPVLAPELFKTARSVDTARYKQFRKGVTQLDEEGVVQALRTAPGGEPEPILAAVGQMQFEVAAHRLREELGADVVLEATSFRLARLAHPDDIATLEGMRDVVVARRASGDALALFSSPYRLEAALRDHPDLRLETILRI